MDWTESARLLDAREGANTTEVDALIQRIAECGTVAGATALLANLGAPADRLPLSGDEDYAAVALQTGAALAIPAVRRAMLAEALDRASICAAGATSGSEAMARMVHVDELRSLLREAENASSPS